MNGERDRWAEWLLSRRHGNDAAVFERRLPNLHRFRDRVLDNAAIEPGDVILDIGAGDGLIGFGAMVPVVPRRRLRGRGDLPRPSLGSCQVADEHYLGGIDPNLAVLSVKPYEPHVSLDVLHDLGGSLSARQRCPVAQLDFGWQSSLPSRTRRGYRRARGRETLRRTRPTRTREVKRLPGRVTQQCGVRSARICAVVVPG